jgi:triosephosphate isomerase
MAKPLIVGNWKMHKTVGEAVDFARRLRDALAGDVGCTVAVAPPFTAIYPVAQALKGSGIGVCAQNMHEKAAGAYTGEVSAPLLVDAGCEYVIIGHSERRTHFGEGDDVVNRKMKSALGAGLRAICCIGETLEEREAGKTFPLIERQLKKGLSGLTAAETGRVTVAYEPVWAIGTGKTAAPEEAGEVHLFIRSIMKAEYGDGILADLAVIYGGSVNPANIADLMARPEIGGVLVGGASLDLESFTKIVKG